MDRYTLNRNYPELMARYVPEIYDVDDAVAAIEADDPRRTEEELTALKAYVSANIDEGEEIVASCEYNWCSRCGHMVGYEDHYHCNNRRCNAVFDSESDDRYSCGYCENCCECFICDRCSEHTDSGCHHCDRCSDCCNCSFCQSCDNNTVDCYDCDCCDGCCECNGIIDDINECGSAIKASRETLKHFNSTRLAGVEWEYNSITDRGVNLLSGWKEDWDGRIHKDGSCGYEAVTPPMAGDNIANCLSDLGKALGYADADSSCGIHVHVDARDVSWQEMYKILHVYSKYEAFLYMLAGDWRIKNTYCKPCGTEYLSALGNTDRKLSIIGVAINSSNDGVRDRMKHSGISKKDCGRYRSLNIMPWLAGRRKGKSDTTIEFRLHGNSLDSSKVIGWTQLCVRLIDWCVKASWSEINDLPKSALAGFIKVISPDLKNYILKSVNEYKNSTSTDRDGNGDIRHVRFRNGEYVIVMNPHFEERPNWQNVEEQPIINVVQNADSSYSNISGPISLIGEMPDLSQDMIMALTTRVGAINHSEVNTSWFNLTF